MKTKKKILLALLPFWPPLVPPMGISCLKTVLQQQGCGVKAVDCNVEEEFRQIYDDYFNTLEENIPTHHRGNFYNVGLDVLQNHMTAHLHPGDEEDHTYIHLIKTVIEKNFYYPVARSVICKLDRIIAGFYIGFERYFTGLLEKETPDVLGLSLYKGTLAASLFAFKLAKERYPRMKTVMGGGIFADHLSLGSPNFENFVKNTPYIDHIMVGEGELLFLKWLKGKLPAAQKVYTQEDIGDKTLDISSMPIPDFSDFQLDHYAELAAYTSRSCPYQCSFCSETVNWGKYRKKSAAHVLAELSELYKKYRYQLFLMSDSLLNPIIDQLAEELANSGLFLYWDGYLRADRSAGDVERCLRWRRGGFYRARLGLESGSQRVLEAMNKKVSPGQIKDAVSTLASCGIKTTTYWVIGYPGETEKDFRETLEIIEQLRDDIYEAECNPFRYYWSGQVHSRQWLKKNRPQSLYPESANDRLMLQTWIMDKVEPTREETYSRVNRFVRHCDDLGIPNPYTWQDIYKADERWKRLHKNAVPPLVEFKNRKAYINECKDVKKVLQLKNTLQDEGDFIF